MEKTAAPRAYRTGRDTLNDKFRGCEWNGMIWDEQTCSWKKKKHVEA